VKKLKLDEICIDGGTQTRAQINQDTIAEYAADMEAGHKFPDVVVFHDGKVYWLADGFHRVLAAERLTFKDINCDVHKGGKLDAIKYALSANTTHGLPRTNKDKRRCVEVALEHWGKFSDRKIADMCGVSHPFVSEVRPLETVSNATRTTSDGRQYPAHKQKSTYTDAATVNPCAKCGHEKAKHISGKGECKTILGSGAECACMEYAGPVAPVKVPDGEMPSATAMINKIEGKKEIDMKPVNGMPEGKGVILANDAINILREIPKNDKLRAVGFKMVKDWINQHKEQ
jgi:uncharacterized ParB-like nuclease family protein